MSNGIERLFVYWDRREYGKFCHRPICTIVISIAQYGTQSRDYVTLLSCACLSHGGTSFFNLFHCVTSSGTFTLRQIIVHRVHRSCRTSSSMSRKDIIRTSRSNSSSRRTHGGSQFLGLLSN